MTTEIQTFITLDEIIGLRFECRHCRGRFSVPLKGGSKLLNPPEYSDPFRCPHCGQPWFEGSYDERLLLLRKFVSNLQEVQNHTNMPFHVMLEIKRDVLLGRASGDKG
jgi:hypothetical protein